MTPEELTRLTALNREEYAEDYHRLQFLDAPAAEKATERRQALLQRLSAQATTAWKGSKIFTGPLSPGCRLCGEGKWSCLFVNGRCNCRCFYCPTSQEEIGLPTTNTVSFRTPAAYTDYLERFAFAGASLSGGEPLLTPGRTLGFLTAMRRKFSHRLSPVALYQWYFADGRDGGTAAGCRT